MMKKSNQKIGNSEMKWQRKLPGFTEIYEAKDKQKLTKYLGKLEDKIEEMFYNKNLLSFTGLTR